MLASVAVFQLARPASTSAFQLDISVSYRADPTLYIRQITGADADWIADANIPSGQYFTVGNALLIATASIASGDAIIPGTNCTQTDLAAALNALNI